MILFAEDWRKYPTAIVDTDTPNKSFVHLAQVFKKMGIKNHSFILSLLNPKLKGVDPHSPDLTQEQMVAIAYECWINPWYFFREVARVPAQSGVTLSPFLANRGNISLIWCFFTHITIFLVQIRQTGKSLSTDMLMSYLLNIKCRNTKINLMTKDDNLRRENIERLKDIIEVLPPYLKAMGKGDANNGEEVTVNALGNTYNTHVPQTNKMRALNAGRGLTSSIFHVDEGPFQPNIDISLPAALPAMAAAVEKAKANNEPYGVIITTTAGKQDEQSGKYMYDLLQSCTTWTEELFDCVNEEEARETVIRNNSSRLCMVNATFSHRQLGKTDEWLRDRIREALAKGDAAERDFLNIWTKGGAGSPFSEEVAQRITDNRVESPYVEVHPKYRYMTRWYIPKEDIQRAMNESDFVMGLDSSEASGGDYTAVVVVDIRKARVVATAILNDINIYSFIDWVAQFLIKYPRVTLIPERRSMGQAIIDGLLKILPQNNIDPFKRIFNLIVNNNGEHVDRWNEIRNTPLVRRDEFFYNRFKGMFGFATAGNGIFSRTSLMTSTLSFASTKFAENILDSNLINQLMGLEEREGRVDHSVKGHDDLVIAWLLTMWLMSKGSNLSYYGIESRLIMSKAEEDKIVDPFEKAMKEEQKKIREKINEILDQIKEEQDDYIVTKLEQQLRVLDSSLVLEEGEVFSMEDLVRKVKEIRRNNKARKMPYQHHYYRNTGFRR